MLRDGAYKLLDVKTTQEYAEGHIAGSILILLSELEARLGQLQKDKPLIVYCRSGVRSSQASDILKANGFSQIYDMIGGFNEWSSKGYPVEK